MMPWDESSAIPVSREERADALRRALTRDEVVICRDVHLGDVIAATAVATALKRLDPRLRITWMAKEGIWMEILEHHPDIDEVVSLDAGAQPDIDLRDAYRRYAIPRDTHLSQMFCDVAGLDIPAPAPRLGIHSGERAQARAFLRRFPRPWVAVGLRSRVPQRTVWDSSWEGFARLMGELSADGVGECRGGSPHPPTPSPTRGEGETELDAGPTLFGLGALGEPPAPAGFVDCMGRFTIRMTAAVIGECDLFVGVDSGLMHIAAATGRPIVAVSQAAKVSKRLPRQCDWVDVRAPIDCVPCYSRCRIDGEMPPCGNVPPELLAEAALAKLKGGKGGVDA